MTVVAPVAKMLLAVRATAGHKGSVVDPQSYGYPDGCLVTLVVAAAAVAAVAVVVVVAAAAAEVLQAVAVVVSRPAAVED